MWWLNKQAVLWHNAKVNNSPPTKKNHTEGFHKNKIDNIIDAKENGTKTRNDSKNSYVNMNVVSKKKANENMTRTKNTWTNDKKDKQRSKYKMKQKTGNMETWKVWIGKAAE